MTRKQKYKYMKKYLREKKIKDSFMKRGIYAAMFDMPKKMEKALKESKNKNHKEYMIRTFLKISLKSKSENVIKLLKTEGE
jgi:hypothetical protein